MFKVNEYFDGKVKSLGFLAGDDNATIGVMAAGEYTFATSTIELMTITSGELQVRLPGSESWNTFQAGTTFEVAADSSFDVKAASNVAYLCIYK